MTEELPKVVVVGFNKCATRSLGHLFSGSGHRAIHHKLHRPLRRSRNAARIMLENIRSGDPVFKGMEDFTLYTDLLYVTEAEVFEGNSVFDKILEDYPGTILLLNLRNRDSWLQSRLRHGHGEFANRYMKATGCASLDELKQLWANTWDDHIQRVRNFARSENVRLIEYDVESDSPMQLIEAFPEYHLKAECWDDTGRSRGRNERSIVTRLRRAWAHLRPRSYR